MPDSSLAVGVDLVAIKDVAASVAQFGDRYIRRVFTSGEAEFCGRDPVLATARFAARFAAKEAAIKVLRPRLTDAIPWSSIEVRRHEGGWCDLVLHGAARALAEREGVRELAMSMSHDGDYATATVIGRRTTVPE